MSLPPYPAPRRPKLFAAQQSFRRKLGDLSQFDESKAGHKSHLLDISKESHRRSRDPSTIFKTNISHFQPMNTEPDTEITIGKDTLLSQRHPLKLENLFTNISSVQPVMPLTLRLAKQKLEAANISNYLGYLDNSSNRDLESFRKKMVARLESRRNQRTETQKLKETASDWVENFLPPEVKEVKEISTKEGTGSIASESPQKLRPINLPEITSIEIYTPKNASSFAVKSPLVKGTRSSGRVVAAKLRRISPEKKSSVEKYSDGSIALKLAEDVARNYRFYQENAMKNRDLHYQITAMMVQEDVLEIFHGKVYRKLSLPMRIYRHMVEFIEKDTKITRGLSIDKLPSRSKAETDMATAEARIIKSRYDSYMRINEKLLEVSLEFRVQGVESLQVKLMQAHEDFKTKKFTTLKRMSKVNSEKYFRMKTECDDLERLIPMHGDISNEKKSQGLEPRRAEPSSFTKATRTVNRKLNNVVKNLQVNLREPSDDYY